MARRVTGKLQAPGLQIVGPPLGDAFASPGFVVRSCAIDHSPHTGDIADELHGYSLKLVLIVAGMGMSVVHCWVMAQDWRDQRTSISLGRRNRLRLYREGDSSDA